VRDKVVKEATMDTIQEIRQKIVTKLGKGEDVSELTQQLAMERAKLAAVVEVEELQKVTDQRKEQKRQAEEIQEKVKLQNEAIDCFLELAGRVLKQVQPALEPAKELARMGSMNRDGPGVIWEQFHDSYQFQVAIGKTRREYLPEGFGCPRLELSPGMQPAYDKPLEVFSYLTSAVGILANFRKGMMMATLKPVDDGIGFNGHGDPALLTDCVVCRHPESETINKLLQEGKPLRAIEEEFGASRSSLSRHKTKCLNLGIVRAKEESPASSANMTYFRG
jgi:hypothetical protein